MSYADITTRRGAYQKVGDVLRAAQEQLAPAEPYAKVPLYYQEQRTAGRSLIVRLWVDGSPPQPDGTRAPLRRLDHLLRVATPQAPRNVGPDWRILSDEGTAATIRHALAACLAYPAGDYISRDQARQWIDRWFVLRELD